MFLKKAVLVLKNRWSWSTCNLVVLLHHWLNTCKMVRKTELKSTSISFSSFNIVSYFIYTDLISSLLDPRLVDHGLTLIHVGAYDPCCLKRIFEFMTPLFKFKSKRLTLEFSIFFRPRQTFTTTSFAFIAE